MVPRVLVVQCDPDLEDVEQVVAADGDAALHLLRRERFDTVIVDLGLAPIDSWCVLATVGNWVERPRLVAIVSDADHVGRAIVLGADLCLAAGTKLHASVVTLDNGDAQGDELSDTPNTQLPQTDDEWRQRLTPTQFEVARKAGTERAFTGEYWDCHDDGTYRCVCCDEPLFSSDTKFESGTGWPSFFSPVEANAVAENVDTTHGMTRTEAVCRNCGAHLGHVFPDGPRPTGLRYCMNSASLRLDRETPPAR